MVPSQLRIREILNYYIPGILLLYIGDIVYYFFNNQFYLIQEEVTIKNAVLAFAILYVIGYLLNISYGLLVAYNEGFIKGKAAAFLRFVFGRKHKNDRLKVYNENKNLLDRKIVLLLQISQEELYSLKPGELFYTVAEYVVNKSSEKSSDELGRQIISSFFALKLSFVCLLSILTFATLFGLKCFGLGFIESKILITGFFISLFVQRISWTLFKVTNEIWAGKVWRMLIATPNLEDKK
ncbi:MAG: hypothetical protein JNJ57_12220 [Saprospiraceae bacterium]|nr:hypothetical protein [Saprospiraceae bacterium]